ncbi:hypothetical protein AURDEDRAFT_177961 [Auricularia subglabra TFB-10046 SS5]|uniref:Uncharacterized protein n=1 Tax=Auricularia subglabra (strain TFB-10046 / SS5) TaxID=717982 RepID=J0L9C9_AURST|nr:hypothetical protein AURDEDRAFT_177961 [Auricularia subglabra TFB-10046 SS5]
MRGGHIAHGELPPIPTEYRNFVPHAVPVDEGASYPAPAAPVPRRSVLADTVQEESPRWMRESPPHQSSSSTQRRGFSTPAQQQRAYTLPLARAPPNSGIDTSTTKKRAATCAPDDGASYKRRRVGKTGGERKPDYWSEPPPNDPANLPAWFPKEKRWPKVAHVVDNTRARMDKLFLALDYAIYFQKAPIRHRTPRPLSFINLDEVKMFGIWDILREAILNALNRRSIKDMPGLTGEQWRRMLKVSIGDGQTRELGKMIGLARFLDVTPAEDSMEGVEDQRISGANLGADDGELNDELFRVPEEMLEVEKAMDIEPREETPGAISVPPVTSPADVPMETGDEPARATATSPTPTPDPPGRWVMRMCQTIDADGRVSTSVRAFFEPEEPDEEEPIVQTRNEEEYPYVIEGTCEALLRPDEKKSDDKSHEEEEEVDENVHRPRRRMRETQRHEAQPEDWYDSRANCEYWYEAQGGLLVELHKTHEDFEEITRSLECWFDFDRRRRLYFRHHLVWENIGQDMPSGECMLNPNTFDWFRKGLDGSEMIYGKSRRIWPSMTAEEASRVAAESLAAAASRSAAKAYRSTTAASTSTSTPTRTPASSPASTPTSTPASTPSPSRSPSPSLSPTPSRSRSPTPMPTRSPTPTPRPELPPAPTNIEWLPPDHGLEIGRVAYRMASSRMTFDGHPLKSFDEEWLTDSWRSYIVWELLELDFRNGLYAVDYAIRREHPQAPLAMIDPGRRRAQLHACWGGGNMKPDESQPSPYSLREPSPALLPALEAMFQFMVVWPRAVDNLVRPAEGWNLGNVDELASMVFGFYAQSYFDYLRCYPPMPHIRPPLPWDTTVQ